jgi:hypothetical protein
LWLEPPGWGVAAAPASAATRAQIISAINAVRHANGLPLVREDPALSAGCAAYDNYRRLNGSVQDGFTPGPEDPSKPGYTAAGARTSRESLLNAGDRPADSWTAGDVFDDAPGHQFQLMNPDVAVVGVDQLDLQLGAFFGTAYLSCIDTGGARRRPRPRNRTCTRISGRTAPRQPTRSIAKDRAFPVR